MTESMIERVGKAIAEEDGADFESFPLMYKAQAIAAVRALREPTQDVVSVGAANISPWWSPAMRMSRDFGNTDKAAASAFNGMIDSILSDTE